MNRVFLDTVGLLALWDKDDQWNERAREGFSRIAADKTPILTTTFVLAECGNAAARRPYRDHVCLLREQLETAGAVVHPSEDDWRLAWVAYAEGHAGGAGIVDQVSFVVMRRLGIASAFTNDRHSRAAGFNALF